LFRRAVTVVAGAAAVLVALVFAVSLGVGPSPTTPASETPSPVASSALGDLPLVTVAPAASPLDAGSPAASPSVSPAVSPAVGPGVRANRIKIVRLGIDLAVVAGDGVDTPIGKVAHYPGSAWPGGGSNIYIYGHARAGMFLPLWQIQIGDTVEMDLVDGTSRTYVVTKILPKVAYDAVRYLAPTPTEQLTLQTCTSYYATAPRFIVIAVPQT
jgi:LPXTG-site transpeptidase (sortase) family protein